MKKRLLSAALALAMVLTLLPFSAMPASAATIADGATASYHAKFDNVITDNGTNAVPAWYAEVRGADNKVTGYEKITSGFIVGSKYYSTWDQIPTKDTLTSFTAIGSSLTATLGTSVTSVNADLYGDGTSLTISGATALTSVTVTDSKYASEVSAGLRQKADKATLTAVGTLASDKAVSISLTNVASNVAVNLATTNTANPVAALGHRVTLNNASLGTITLGTLGGQANATSPKSSVAQNITLTNGSSCGKITVKGNGSRVQFTDSGDANTKVDIQGTGASFTMAGNSSAGALTLFGVSKDNNGGKDSTAAPPSVTITAGSVGTITYSDDDAAKGNASVQLNSSSAYSSKVTMNKGTVTINSGHAGGVELKEGTLNVSGAGATTGDLTLGTTKDTTLNVSGTGHTVGKIDGTMANLTLNIPESRTNTYGKTGTDLSTYTKHSIKGGTWTVEVPYSALDASLAWQLNNATAKTYTYYTQEQLGEALTAQVKLGVTANALTPTNSTSSSGSSTLEFKSGTVTWGKITKLATDDVIILPSSVNSTATGRWTEFIATKPGTSYSSGYRYTMPADTTVVLDAGGGAASGNATKLINAKITSTNVDTSVRASINGNVITLTGSLPIQTTPIELELTTDVQDDQGVYRTVKVTVIYNSSDKKLTFRNPGSTSLGFGITVPDLDRLRLSNETIYTLSASVKDINAALQLDSTGKAVEVTVSASAYATQALRDGLKAALEGTTPGDVAEFDWTTAPAIIQAINDVMGGTTDSQIKSWKDAANRAHYLKNHTSVPSTGIPANYLVYDTVHLVPYLAVTVNEHNSQGGTMKGTMTPMYRIEVRDSDPNPVDPFVAQTGRTLGALTGVMAEGTTNVGAKVKFASLDYPTTAAFGGTASLFAHQDGTYVYGYDRSNGMTITHAGKTGLGAFEINKTDGLVTLYEGKVEVASGVATVTPENKVATYSTLQAAVDDAKNAQLIVVDQNYTGSTSINVTGEARTIYVQAVGKTVVVANASGNLVESNNYGNLYSIKLNRDTAPIGGNITVSSATGGTASVSANPATAGQKVTVTLSAQAGYTPSGVSVKDSSGKAVSVSGSGSSYSFTMPAGSVTVTPSFTKTQVATNPTVHVSGTTGGSAYTSAGNNQVAPGTTVTVTTTPGTNQRTMGVSVTGATAVRTGANTFQFTVPSGYNTVTVTPRFDANNGTLFQDVWSYEYYSNPVRWAVERGITNGTSTYTFGSENVCTREDMVTFLWRAAGSPAVSSSVRNPFWDVQAGSYYYNAVLWAVSKGITNGVSANQFGVGQYVTRGQAVTFLYRYEGSPAAGTNSGFYDVNSREYYAKAVSWANAKGVTNGTSATTFGPNEYCKRAQIVTFLYRDITGNRA